MDFVNRSNNTIFLSDIDKNIPFLGDEVQHISLDNVKKSNSFRLLVSMGQIEITKCGKTALERSLLKSQKESKEKIIKQEEDEKIEMESCKDLEVKIRGHFYEAGGYAKVNRNIAEGLHKLGVRVNIDASNKYSNNLNEAEIKRLSHINKTVSRKAISIDSMIPTFSSMSASRYRILYTTVEAYSIPQQFVDISNSYNEIWVTSDFCKEILEKHNVSRPIYVIPDSIDTNLYNENSDPYEFNPSLKDFVFISVFGWSYRKGYDVLLKSYLEEFSSDDPVSLLIVSRFNCNAHGKDVIKDVIKRYIDNNGKSEAAHIARCSSIIPENRMPNIYRAADAFVLFSRGEGFGLPYCESSLCGLPVIGSNCSAQTMFLKKSNSYLVDVDNISEMQPGSMHVHYWDGQMFPELQSKKVIRDARKQMRYVYENYSEAQKKNKKLQKVVKTKYNIPTVAQMAKDRLDSIWSKL